MRHERRATLRMSPGMQKISAVGLLIVLLSIASVSLLGPLWAAHTERSLSFERMQRSEAALSTEPLATRRYRTEELVAERLDRAGAQIALQTLLDRMVRENTLNAMTVRPLPPDDLDGLGETVWVELNLIGDLQALVDLLSRMDEARPTLLLRQLEIRNDQARAPGTLLQLRLEAGQAWRPSEAATP